MCNARGTSPSQTHTESDSNCKEPGGEIPSKAPSTGYWNIDVQNSYSPQKQEESERRSQEKRPGTETGWVKPREPEQSTGFSYQEAVTRPR